MVNQPAHLPFADTILGIGASGHVEVDLRLPLPTETITALRNLFPGGQFAVVTPFNPNGAQLSLEENAHRLAEFRAGLDRPAIRTIPADGWSPDRTHVEQGVACDLDLAAALVLANQWEQLALFWFDGSLFWLVHADGTSIALGHSAEEATS